MTYYAQVQGMLGNVQVYLLTLNSGSEGSGLSSEVPEDFELLKSLGFPSESMESQF